MLLLWLTTKNLGCAPIHPHHRELYNRIFTSCCRKFCNLIFWHVSFIFYGSQCNYVEHVVIYDCRSDASLARSLSSLSRLRLFTTLRCNEIELHQLWLATTYFGACVWQLISLSHLFIWPPASCCCCIISRFYLSKIYDALKRGDDIQLE
jgi:hypothetical protein